MKKLILLLFLALNAIAQNLPTGDPIQAVIKASAAADLTIAGTSRTWGIERQTLGRYTDKLAGECESSLLITRRYNQVADHINSLIDEQAKNFSKI